jgi:hypothetical protein
MRITLTSQAAIEARLLTAPEEDRPAHIKAAGGVRINGIVGPADGDMSLPMIPDSEPPESVKVGSPVHVTVAHDGEGIAFYTTISEITEDGHLLLRFPAAVQIEEHRDDFREPVEPDECVRIELTDGGRSLSFPVIDMSRAGLSFRFTPGAVLLSRGDKFTARLTAPGLVPYVANIEVSNVRRDPESRGGKVAGVSVIRPPPDLLVWLHRAGEQLRAAAS